MSARDIASDGGHSRRGHRGSARNGITVRHGAVVAQGLSLYEAKELMREFGTSKTACSDETMQQPSIASLNREAGDGMSPLPQLTKAAADILQVALELQLSGSNFRPPPPFKYVFFGPASTLRGKYS